MLDDLNFQLGRGSAMQEAPRELAGVTRTQMLDLVNS